MGGTDGLVVKLDGFAEVDHSSGEVTRLDFVVANFPVFMQNRLSTGSGGGERAMWLGGLTINTDAWSLVLDKPARNPDISGALREQGGCGVTHVGRLVRRDGARFDPKAVLPPLSQFLSFVAGAYAPALLPDGFDSAGTLTWRRWESLYNVSPLPHRCIFPEFVSVDGRIVIPEFGAVLDSFMSHWSDPNWRELLQLGVDWYLTANTQTNADTVTILAQAGLELAAWHNLVHSGRLSGDGFRRLPAKDLLSLILSDASVAREIPAALGALTTFARARRPGFATWEPWTGLARCDNKRASSPCGIWTSYC
jgi:hypothetical protein